ncbi:hypothetical protein J1614_009828 [Plenodomus biglobosus]|nr:hypothetical protein J1614_009828 [Plenodomus biglobosus]
MVVWTSDPGKAPLGSHSHEGNHDLATLPSTQILSLVAFSWERLKNPQHVYHDASSNACCIPGISAVHQLPVKSNRGFTPTDSQSPYLSNSSQLAYLTSLKLRPMAFLPERHVDEILVPAG